MHSLLNCISLIDYIKINEQNCLITMARVFQSITPRNFEMAIISPSNGCNDLYPLEFTVQLLNGRRGDLLDELLLKMKLCSTEQGVFGHQEMLRSGEVLFKSSLLTRR